MAEQNINNTPVTDEESKAQPFSIHDIVYMVLSRWYWFALSVLLCLLCAYIYVARTPKTYHREAMILVKDSRKGGDTDIAMFSDLAGFSPRRNVDNELFILNSHALMYDVVTRLGLTVEYRTQVGMRNTSLYKRSPLTAVFVNAPEALSCSFNVELLDSSKVQLSKFSAKTLSKADRKLTIDASFGDTILTPIGQVIITPTIYNSPEYAGKTVSVHKYNADAIAHMYRSRVKSEVVNKLASIISISFNDEVAKRAEDVINALIVVYEEDAVRDKQRISESTAKFIEDRLDIIGDELKDVEKGIEDLKKSNQLFNLDTEATRSVSESSRYKTEGLSIENQIQMAEYIRDYLKESDTSNLVPSTSIADSSIASQIADYNEVLLNRNRLLSNSSESNPVVKELERELIAVRNSILASIDSHISTLNIQLEALRREEKKSDMRLSNISSQEKEFLSISRQQRIKEELYLYLLNKREENALALAITESNSRTIDSAFGSNIPIAPKIPMILLAALIIGLAIPFAIIYIIEMMDTSVKSKRDIENNTSVPLLGDIPAFTGTKHKYGVAVKENGRDPVSEAFRMLRTNLQFMNIYGTGNKVLMLTSSNAHSGKTFISTNFALTLAFAGKKVLIIDLDLRKRSLTSHFGHRSDTKGISSYLAGTVTNVNDIIHRSSAHDNLYLMFAGMQPPNPAEMLLSERLDELIAMLKQEFDYIIIDSVPAMSIADAMITSRLADISIYVIREGLLDKRQLPDVERLYRDKKLRNMCIVLNGVTSQQQGYGYGYGYGYYGYGESSTTSKHRVKEFFALMFGTRKKHK